MKLFSLDFFKNRSMLYVVSGGLLLVLYITSLLFYNFQDNKALQKSSLKRYKLDVVKQADTIGYFFLERKYSIRSLADSMEVLTYFTNRSLGMSEQYGLRVSLFTVKQLFLSTLHNKTINLEPIYKDFIFLDENKRELVNASLSSLNNYRGLPTAELDKIVVKPQIVVQKNDSGYEVLLVCPCFFKKKLAGWIVSSLELNTLYKNFLNQSAVVTSKASALAIKNGQLVLPAGFSPTILLWPGELEKITATKDLEIVSSPSLSKHHPPLLLTRIHIQSSPLCLVAYVERGEVMGNVRGWLMLAVAGAFIVLVIFGLFLFFSSNTKHLILTARIDESKKQQDKLTAKNRQLKDEIGKREEVEQSLKENEERYRKLFDSASDAIVIVDGNRNRIIDCNDRTCELLKFSRDEILNLDLSTFTPKLQPDGSAFSAEYLRRKNGALTQPQHFEWVMQTADAEKIDVDISMIALSITSKIMIQVIIRDVTERKKTQELLVQTEKMMAVGGLAAGMAHEINNPLGVILQANQNLGRRLSDTLEKNRKTALAMGLDFDKMLQYLEDRSINRYLNSIQSAGERAAKIVKSMLEFGRSSGTSNKQEFQVEEILEDSLEISSKDYDIKRKFDFKKIEIVRSYDDVDPIMCNKSEIMQVFVNIIKNAAQAMHETAVGKPVLKLKIEQGSGVVNVTIEDNGPGMSESVQNQIFEPFFTTKPVGEGTGLGMSVSYFIVTSHHRGNISLESREGAGSRFTVELPC